MGGIPLSWMLATLALLLALSGFFSISETAMMAFNRARFAAAFRFIRLRRLFFSIELFFAMLGSLPFRV